MIQLECKSLTVKKFQRKIRPKPHGDISKYCKDIGILSDEMPQLVTTINERGNRKRRERISGLRNCYGRWFIKDRIVFVNANTRLSYVL